jgi:hypothetical protein
MVGEPPVVMFTTASVACLMRGRNCMNTADRRSGGHPAGCARAGAGSPRRPGSADRLRGDLVGRDRQRIRHGRVWIAPVMAQLMMTLSDLAALRFSRFQLEGSGSGFGHIRGKGKRRPAAALC